MLVLSRKASESIVIDGRIVVRIMRIDGDVVKVGIQAPAEVAVHRQEVYDEIQRNNKEALTRPNQGVPKLSPVAPAKTSVSTKLAEAPLPT